MILEASTEDGSVRGRYAKCDRDTSRMNAHRREETARSRESLTVKESDRLPECHPSCHDFPLVAVPFRTRAKGRAPPRAGGLGVVVAGPATEVDDDLLQ
jgi:hypothetical protein